MQKCKICQSDTNCIEDPQMDWLFYQCQKCAFSFKDDQFIVSKEDEKKQYDNHNNSLENIGYVQMFERFITQAISPYAKGKETLEFGCGPGPVLAHLLSVRGYNVSKYDKFYYPEENYKESCYDLITATEVIEHLEDPMEYLRQFVSLLNPDGIISLMTLFHPNKTSSFLQWWYRRDPTHISFFHPQTINVICEILGLRLLYIDEKNSFTLTVVK